MSTTALSTTDAEAFAHDFRRSGFGIINGTLDPDTTTGLRDRLHRLLADDSTVQTDGPQRLMPRLVEQDTGFADLATHPLLVTVLRAIFDGVNPHLVASYGHEKPAGSRTHTGLHSDVAHLPGVPHHESLVMVKVMYALTAVRAGFGETAIYPGSHHWLADTAPHGIAHHVRLDPGDVLLFHANARHTATDNPSPRPRLSLWYTFALPWMRIFPGYEYSEDFLTYVARQATTRPELADIYGLADPYATSPRRTGRLDR